MRDEVGRTDMRGEIEPEFCIGSGCCEERDPDHFRLDENGIARWVEDGPPPDPEVLVDVARLCPQRAIIIKDGSGAQVAP